MNLVSVHEDYTWTPLVVKNKYSKPLLLLPNFKKMKNLLNKYPYSNKTEIFNSIESVSKLETRSSITLSPATRCCQLVFIFAWQHIFKIIFNIF
jgi:hypothetical protein